MPRSTTRKKRTNAFHHSTLRNGLLLTAAFTGAICTYKMVRSLTTPKKVIKIHTDVPPLKTLPILTSDNVRDFPEWHAYYETIYNHPVQDRVDLNEFNWFYWFSPLGRCRHITATATNQCIPYDTPLVMNVNFEWKLTLKFFFNEKNVVPPENIFAKIGFFVKRRAFNAVDKPPYIEVLRTNSSVFTETGVAWFFVTRGSGIFLKSDPLKIVKNRKEFPFNEFNPGKTLNKHTLKSLVLTSPDFYEPLGLVEMIHVLKGKKLTSNKAKLKLYSDSYGREPIETLYTRTEHGYQILTTRQINKRISKQRPICITN